MERRIGFKTKAVIEAEKQEQKNNTPEGEEIVNVTQIQAETIGRMENITNFICGTDFQNLSEEQKQSVLNDFAYYSKVSTYIL